MMSQLATCAGRRLLTRMAIRGTAAAETAAAPATTVQSLPSHQKQQQQQQLRLMSSGGEKLAALAKDNPYKDVVRYEHKNRKWNLQHVDYYSEGLAIGILENGLQPGDVVLSWLPKHFSESMVLQFACSKGGLVLYELDPSLAISDLDAAKKQLRSALELTKANVFITQEAGDDVNYYNIAASVIPEVQIFDFGMGMPFVSPRFPHLRFAIHTGFEQQGKRGMLKLKDMVISSDNLDSYLAGFPKPSGSTPLLGSFQLDANGIPTGLGPTQTNDDVLASGIWDTYSKILNREYHEVEGVGVVW